MIILEVVSTDIVWMNAGMVGFVFKMIIIS